MFAGEVEGAREVEDGGAEVGVAFAGGDGEVAGAAAEVGEMAERVEVEDPDNGGGTEEAEAVHAGQEGPAGLRGAEKVAEEGAFEAEGVGPAVGVVAEGIFEAGPHGEEDVVGVEDVAGEGIRGGLGEVAGGGGGVLVEILVAGEEAEAGAGIEEAGEGIGVGGGFGGGGGGGGGGGVEEVEQAERDGGKEGFGAAEGFDEVEDDFGPVRVHVPHSGVFLGWITKVLACVCRWRR